MFCFFHQVSVDIYLRNVDNCETRKWTRDDSYETISSGARLINNSPFGYLTEPLPNCERRESYRICQQT